MIPVAIGAMKVASESLKNTTGNGMENVTTWDSKINEKNFVTLERHGTER